MLLIKRKNAHILKVKILQTDGQQVIRRARTCTSAFERKVSPYSGLILQEYEILELLVRLLLF